MSIPIFSRLRRIAFLAGALAVVSLAFHIEKDADHSGADAHHCCLCHTAAITAAASPSPTPLPPIRFFRHAGIPETPANFPVATSLTSRAPPSLPA